MYNDRKFQSICTFFEWINESIFILPDYRYWLCDINVRYTSCNNPNMWQLETINKSYVHNDLDRYMFAKEGKSCQAECSLRNGEYITSNQYTIWDKTIYRWIYLFWKNCSTVFTLACLSCCYTIGVINSINPKTHTQIMLINREL